MSAYGISSEYSRSFPKGRWTIRDGDAKPYPGKIVWERRIKPADAEHDPYPPDLRAEFERLTGKPEFSRFDEASESKVINIVEMVAEATEEGGFNQPCRFGYLVERHAVYCHNDGWLYAPRKCRRTWYTGGEVKDEDCRGFKARTQEGGA